MAAWLAMAGAIACCAEESTDADPTLMGGASGSGGTSGRGGASAKGGSGGQGGHAGASAGGAGRAGSGDCTAWPGMFYPVSGSGFEAYEGVTAVGVMRWRQSACLGHGDRAEIVNGRFDLLFYGFGDLEVFLDINGDRQYQRTEPQWAGAGGPTMLTPADFDAQREYHVEVVGIPTKYQMGYEVRLAVCTDDDAANGSPDGGCSPSSLRFGVVRDACWVDGRFHSTFPSWRVWFTPDGAFDRNLPHFVGRWTAWPCQRDADLVVCSLSFAELVNGDGGSLTDGGAGDSSASASR